MSKSLKKKFLLKPDSFFKSRSWIFIAVLVCLAALGQIGLEDLDLHLSQKGLVAGLTVINTQESGKINQVWDSPKSNSAATNASSSSLLELAQVDRVIDGDTIELSDGRKVRYIGIDTPESVAPRKPVECFAKEATNRNVELVAGQTVSLEKDVSETDRYGRLLRYVYVHDVMVNQILVSEGYAKVSTYPPDVKYQELFVAAESEARESARGKVTPILCTPNRRV